MKFVALGLAVIAAIGCGSSNEVGDLIADRTGDLSHPLATRGAPDDAERAGCGDGAVASGSAIVRRPYLQQVTATSARVRWTTTSTAPAVVDVSTRGGEVVAAVEAAPIAAPVAADRSRPVEATINGLAPATLYCYAVRAGDRTDTARAGFRTAPAPGSDARIAFVAFGDSGSSNADQLAILGQIRTVPFDLIVHTGDLAYDTGTAATFERVWFTVYAELIRSFAVYPCIGNHDAIGDDGGAYLQDFDLPANGRPDGTERWYSFDRGQVHLVALDTTRTGDKQAAWLEADLAANPAAWTVVFLHHPPFSSGEHGSDADVRRWFVPIFARHHVDLVLAGHDHDYERTKPQDGVNYIVTGGGGRGTRPVGTSEFTAFSDQVENFVYVVIDGDTLELHAIDGVGTEFDQLVVAHAR